MKNAIWCAAALLACVGLVRAPAALAQYEFVQDGVEVNPYETANLAAEDAGASLAAYDSYDSYDTFDNGEGGFATGACDSCESDDCCGSCSGGCSGGGCLDGCGFLSRPGQFFVGSEYLHVRSTFSEATAFVTLEPDATTPLNITFHQLEYDYQPSYRVYGGYRFCDCGGEIRFSFTNYDNLTASVRSPFAQTGVRAISTHFGEPVIASGSQVLASSTVGAKSYDLGFAKTIPLGSPAVGNCGCGDIACDSCCGWCPAWDIKWSAAIRFAQVNWNRNATEIPQNPMATFSSNSTTMNFDGGGARVGLEGTRYIGRRQRFALFAKGDMSLLLGSVDIETTIGTASAANGRTVNSTVRFSSTQIIPVLEIEAGSTFYVTSRLSVASGYLFAAWYDLGMRDTFLVSGSPTFDDANILGFDGFFARAELSF